MLNWWHDYNSALHPIMKLDFVSVETKYRKNTHVMAVVKGVRLGKTHLNLKSIISRLFSQEFDRVQQHQSNNTKKERTPEALSKHIGGPVKSCVSSYMPNLLRKDLALEESLLRVPRPSIISLL